MTQKTIDERIAHAMEMHDLSFNCAQCTLIAVADLVDIDPKTAFLLAEGLGGGLGGSGATCGAVLGAAMAISAANSAGIELHNTKLQTYGLVKEMAGQFGEEFDAIDCPTLKPTNPNEVKPTCNGYITAGVRLAVKYIEEIKARD